MLKGRNGSPMIEWVNPRIRRRKKIAAPVPPLELGFHRRVAMATRERFGVNTAPDTSVQPEISIGAEYIPTIGQKFLC